MNIPSGSQHDTAAPWNQPTRRTLWQEYYITADVGEDMLRQFRVYFPWRLSTYDTTELAKSYCKDYNLYFIDVYHWADKRVMTCLTEVYYE